MKRRPAVVLLYLALAVLVFPVFPHFVSPNEFSRWLLAASIVERGTIEVTELAPLFGSRFEDLSERDGRLYSNKAPGAALVGIPAYVAARVFVGKPSATNLRVTLTAMRLIASTLPLVGLALAMAALASRLGAAEESVTFGVFVLLFATPLFSYGLIYFAHALTAAAVFAAWALLFGRPDPSTTHCFLAGGLLGLAVISEYPLAVAAIVITVALLWQRRFKALGWVVAGGVPFAVALAMYNTVAFGGPLQLSSGFERLEEFRTIAGTGLFGIGVPSASAAAAMLFGATKGLVLISPILLIGAAAFPAARRVLPRASFVTLIALPVVILLVHCGYANWHGGWAVGPRYLAAAIPFLVFPLMLMRLRIVSFVAAGYSATLIALSSLTFPFPPNGFPLPWATFSAPLLAGGLVAPNAGHFVHRAAAIALPFALVAAALIVSARDLRTVGATAGGFVIAVAIIVAINTIRTPPITERLQLAYVKEVYFEQRGAMRLGVPRPAGLIARRDFELRLPPSSWRF